MDSWWLTQLTPEAAEAHDRRVYNAEPPVMLGWTPYIYRATHNAVAQFACHTEDQLRAKLKLHGLKLGDWGEWREGVRTARLSRV